MGKLVQVVVKLSRRLRLLFVQHKAEAHSLISQRFQSVLALIEQRDQFCAHLLAEKLHGQRRFLRPVRHGGKHVGKIGKDIRRAPH